MAEKRRGLGRGLGALIPSAAEIEEPAEQPEAEPLRNGRPVDLFFPPAKESSAARTGQGAGVNTDALRGASRKTSSRGTGTRSLMSSTRSEEATRSEGVSTRAENASETGSASELDGGKQAGRKGDGTSAGVAGGEDAVTTDEAKGKAALDSAAPSDVVHPADVSRETLVEVPGATFAEIPVGSIHPNRRQPRSVFDEDDMAELVHSIREIGVLQPIVVRPSAENDAEHPYELVMGERRWRATQQAGLKTVPAIVRSTLDVDLLRDALLENLHRSQLNPLEEAAAYQQLLDDFGCSQEELAERIGRSRPQISNTLRLMKLPPLVQRRLAAGVLSAGHARALLGLGDAAEMEKLAQRIVAEGLSVRATEETVALTDGVRRTAKQSKVSPGARHERLDYLASSLSDRLDTSVKITLGARKGKVSIEFASVDDLNRIMGVLNADPSA